LRKSPFCVWGGLFEGPLFLELEQRCRRFLHACSGLCKCDNWLCRTCTPHHTVAGRSSVSLTQSLVRLPFKLLMRPSPHQLHAEPGRALPTKMTNFDLYNVFWYYMKTENFKNLKVHEISQKSEIFRAL
jgi:hypothetical protein